MGHHHEVRDAYRIHAPSTTPVARPGSRAILARRAAVARGGPGRPLGNLAARRGHASEYGVMVRKLFPLLVGAAFVAALALLIPLFRELPSARPVKADLAELARARGASWVPLDRVPQPLREAIIATEDSRFYEHRGLDVVGAARAIT